MTRFNAFWQLADNWQRAAFVAILVGAVAQTAFIAIYMTRPWWRHYVGRALFVKSASLLVVLWLTAVKEFFVYPGQHEVTSVALWVVSGAIVYQLLALVRTPRYAYPPDDRYAEKEEGLV